MDYQKAYALLMGAISNAIDELSSARVSSRETENALRILREVIEKAEEMYLSAEE